MPSQVSMNFGELSTDADFTSGIKNFHDCVNETGQLLQNLCEKDIYEKLDVEDRVKYDLFLSYSLNSLYWLYLRTEGVDPSKHALKSEIDRTKEYFARAQQVQDRKTIMPRINKAAAQRFIRSGLWQPKCNDTDVRVPESQRMVQDEEIVVVDQ